jgi:SAM-dependent methyltransferase
MSRLPGSYFEGIYRDGLDPWGFESRWYEQRKRAITMAALPRPTYRRCFEPGCAIGILTRLLATRCDEVVAWDIHEAAVAECERRCADLANVRVAPGVVPDLWPSGVFDLVVLSEVAYYLDPRDLTALVARLRTCVTGQGTLVAVHWLGETDYPLGGAETHRLLTADLGWPNVVHHLDDEFVLDIWEHR